MLKLSRPYLFIVRLPCLCCNAIKLSITGRRSKRRNYESRESSRNHRPKPKGEILFAEIRVIRSFFSYFADR